MTKEEFIQWQDFMKYNNRKAAKHLGKCADTISDYRTGKTKIPESIAKLCKFIQHFKANV